MQKRYGRAISYMRCLCSNLCCSPVSGLFGLRNYQKPEKIVVMQILVWCVLGDFFSASFYFEVVDPTVIILAERVLVEYLGQSEVEAKLTVELGDAVYDPIRVGGQLGWAKSGLPEEFRNKGLDREAESTLYY